jgi:hypothetical protein
MNNVLEVDQYDVCVYSTENWKELLRNHSAVLHPFRDPPEQSIWFRRSDSIQNSKRKLIFQYLAQKNLMFEFKEYELKHMQTLARN